MYVYLFVCIFVRFFKRIYLFISGSLFSMFSFLFNKNFRSCSCLFACMFHFLCFFFFACLFVPLYNVFCLSVSLSLSLYYSKHISLSICLSVDLLVCLFKYVFICLCLCVYLSFCLSNFLSHQCPSIYFSVAVCVSISPQLCRILFSSM